MWLSSIPQIFMWLWFSARSRAVMWMSPANPSIITGGFTGEPKNEIYDLMPLEILPITLYIKDPNEKFESVLNKTMAVGITFPLICKPNRGERGKKVAKINNEATFRQYIGLMKVDYLIQEYIDLPNEAAVMAYYMPDSKEQGIISITDKEFLNVVGDGKASLLTLMERNMRALLVLKNLKEIFRERLEEILPEGEVFILEPIGNHSRGTGFYDGSRFITTEMIQNYADITRNIKGVFFARYDLKYDTVENLRAGRVKILELNGVGADPGHIYDPKIRVFEKYSIIYRQYKVIYKIAAANRKKGVAVMKLSECLKYWKMLKAYNKLME